LNRDVLGMGQYMNLMFGGWEVASAAAGVRAGTLGAQQAMSPLAGLQSRVQGLQTATGGIMGGTIREIHNLLGPIFGSTTIAGLEETLSRETARNDDLNFVRQSVMQQGFAGSERAARRAGGETGRSRQQLINESQRKRLDMQVEIADLATQLAQPADIGYWRTIGAEVNFGEDEKEVYRIYQEQANRERETTPDFVARRQRLSRMRSDLTRLTEADEEQLRKLDRDDASGRRIESGSIEVLNAQLRDAPAREVQQYAREVRQREEREALGEKYGWGFVDRLVRPRQRRESQFEELQATRLEQMQVGQLRNMNLSTEFSQAGETLYAAQRRIDADFAMTRDPETGQITNFGNIRQNDPRFAGTMTAYNLQQNGALLDEQRRKAMRTGRVRAMEATLDRNPIAAQLEATFGRFNADTVGMKPGSGPYQDALGEARTTARQQVQDFTDYVADVTVSQAGRREVMQKLLNRDQMGAEATSIRQRAREEETKFLRQRLPERAREAREAGQLQLQLQRQNYMDAFRGEQLENKEMIYALFNPRDNENPREILSNLKTEMAGLNKPGSADGPAGPNKEVVEAIERLLPGIRALLDVQ
jgi:hypothetical protein